MVKTRSGSDPAREPILQESSEATQDRVDALTATVLLFIVGIAATVLLPVFVKEDRLFSWAASIVMLAFTLGRKRVELKFALGGAALTALSLFCSTSAEACLVVWTPSALMLYAQGNRSTARFFAVAAGILTAALYFESTGFWWQYECYGSQWADFLIGKVSKFRHDFSFWYTGFSWFLLSLSAIAASVALVSRWNWRLVLAVLVVALGFVIGVGFTQPVSQAAAFLIAMGVLPWEARRTRTGRRFPFAILIYAGIVTTFLFCVAANHNQVPNTALFLNGGLKTLDLPSGPPNAGTEPPHAVFGAMPRLMRNAGWSTDVRDPGNLERDLAGKSLFVVINPQIALSAQDQAAVQSFVSRGGGLLVLGDHTDIAGIRQPLNSLLKFTGIQFNNDSAIPNPDVTFWKGALRTALHHSLLGLDNIGLRISVGATLLVPPGDRVIVSGEQGYSDPGNPNNPVSHLGPMRMMPGDQVGAMPMAAECRYGKGLVQVWGDTSSFQDGSLTWNHEEVLRIISSVATRRQLLDEGVGVILGVCLVIAGLVLEASPIWITLALLLAFCSNRLLGKTVSEPNPSPLTQGTIVYDTSHNPQYPGARDEESQYRFSEIGLRLGTMIIGDDARSYPGKANWIIVNAPTEPFSTSEAANLLNWVSRGGKLLLVSGVQHAFACHELYAALGIHQETEHLGRGIDSRTYSLNLFEMLEGKGPKKVPATGLPLPDLSFVDTYPTEMEGSELLVSAYGKPIVSEKRLGAGRVVVIGDSRFLNDFNLGQHDQLNLASNRFLYYILNR